MQCALFQWAEVATQSIPELEFMYANTNGGKRDIGTAVKLKKEGQKPGVPDIFLPVPKGGYHGLYIELKVGTNKPTKKQQKYLRFLAEQGYCTYVARDDWREPARVIMEYLQQ